MKRHIISNNSIIWLSCLAYIVLISCLLVFSVKRYGIAGASVLLFLSLASLQFFKKIYEFVARRKRKYGLGLAVGITNCWTIYQILNMSLITGWIFSYLIMLAEMEALHIPKVVWLVIILLLACYWSMKPIQPFVRKEKYEGKRRRPTRLITAFVPRFVVLYTFVVYYFISYVGSTESIIPSLCVVYLGVDRLITMYNSAKEYMPQEYYSIFRDTVKWLRKVRKMDIMVG